MGTIAQKLTYLDGTKQALKESINNIGGDITNETTFREYAEQLQNVYDILPKTDYAEGSNITLSNTLKGKLDFEDGIVVYGDTKQESTNGYNVLKLVATTIKSSNTQGTWNNNTYTLYGITFSLDVNSNDVVEKITISGTSTQQATFYLYNNSNYLASGSYLLSGCSNGSNTTYDLRSYNTNNTGEVKQNFTTPISVTSNGGTQAINFALVVRSSQTISNAIIYPMLESGTTAHDWEQYTGGQASPNPSYPQDIEVVTGTQEVKVENVNLLANGVAFTKSTAGWYDQLGNETTTLAQVQASTNYYDLKGGTTYTLKVHNYTNISRCQVIYIANGSLSAFTTISNLNNSATFTPTTDTRVWFRAEMTNTNTNTLMQPQLEKGSTATTYVEHQEQTQIVELSSKNLLDVSSITTPITINGITLTPKGNGTFELKGIATTANAGFVLGKCKFTNGTNYTISNGLSDNAYGKYTMLIPTYAAWGNNTLITGTSTTFQAKSSEEFNIEMVIYNGTDISSGITITPQLEEGSSATPFEEYYNIELCKIGNYQDYLYKTSGKNLLNTSQSNINIGGATSTITYDNAGFMTITNNNSSASYINIPIATDNVEVGQPYTLKVDWGTNELTYIYLQNSNDDYSKYVYTTTTTTTTNTPVSNFLKVLILVNANKTIKVRVQVQKGNTINGNYEPYGTGEWYKKEYITKYVFTSSDNWVSQPYGTNSWVLNYKVNLLVNDSIVIIKSNIFTGIDKNSRNTSTNNIIYGNDSVGIFIRNTELTTQAQVQTATTGNYIYYIASTPNDIEITNETLIEQLDNLEKLKSYNGVTNINCSGNLSAILGVSALKGE